MMPMRSSSGGAVSIGHRTGPNGIYRGFIGWKDWIRACFIERVAMNARGFLLLSG